MRRNKLDEAIVSLRAEQPKDEVVREAGKRVFRTVFDAAYAPETVERIRGCGDFEALIPSYLERSLTPARTALFEDHVHSCVSCRRALEEARGERKVTATDRLKIAEVRPGWNPVFKWGLAAALAAGVAIGVTGALNGLLPGQHTVRATVESVQGTLYKINRFGSSLVTAGTLINSADELRTAKGSRAIFKLLDGARIEMGERSDVSISHGWSGTSVEVERGRVIVQPDANKTKPFLLAVGEWRIPVKDAILAVDRGTKGARVSVAKGSTKIQQGDRVLRSLQAGEQFPAYHLRKASLEGDFAWSSNAGYYRALLQELKTLQDEIRAIPSPGLRYSSNLAQYLPANTIIYAAIPNLGGTIEEARRIFEQRLSESAVLREWWQQQPAARSGGFDRVLEQISAVSSYLGDEIVFAVTSTGAHQYSAPLFLAEVRKPGLAAYIEQNKPAEAKELAIYENERMVAASPDPRMLEQVKQAMAQPGNYAAFTGTAFYQRISQSYSAGAEYLLAADMEQMVTKSVNSRKEVPPGFDNVQYLLLERRDLAPKNTETRAMLSFGGARQGVASWLGAPGPMGSLDFVSPDAYVAASVIMKNPLDIVKDMIRFASQNDPNAAQGFSNMEEHLGISLTNDLAAMVGGDATFAIDGRLVPVPSWRVAIEVYNPDGLNSAIRTVVDHYNQQASAEAGKLVWREEQVNSWPFYVVRNEKTPAFAAYYTFVDGFLLAGADEQSLLQAIQNRENGYTLANSQAFKDQLPADNYLNCSALLWHNAGKQLNDAAGQLKSLPKGSFLAMLATSGPGLICVYGEPDRIVAATKSDFLGFNLSTLAGLGEGKPLPELIASQKI